MATRYCICADPENCREPVPGYTCRPRSAAPVGDSAAMPPEMPEIQVGDWYLVYGRVERPMFPWNVNVEHGRIVHNTALLADIDEIRGERKGVPFVWRRTDRKEPTK